ncbi:alpha/beta hydrolase-fold protein [Massilia sp. CT11-108]|uniref:alpha/beta hydrolase-fold protein n=1 Tax=Massilia sp. CT11-108 TaxID=3393900 RepID=UPI0039A45948
MPTGDIDKNKLKSKTYFMKQSLIRRALFIVSLLLISSSATARELPGKRDSLHSVVLNEDRVIQVLLPENFNPASGQKYDVLYILDGDGNLNTISDIQQFAQNESYMPPVIMVAVFNTNRDRDMTPTHVEQMASSGGADKFLSFLKNELLPYINKTYPVSGNNILYGHSLTGLFSVYAFLAEPQLFNYYLAVDPSLWWDSNYINKIAGDKLNASPGKGKSLFITGRDDAGLKQMGIADIDTLLKEKAPKDLNWKIVGYPDEHHGSLRLKSVYDGLKFFYSGYGTPAVVFHPMNGIVLKDTPYKVYYFGQSQVRYTLDGSEPTSSSTKMLLHNSLVNDAKLTAKDLDRTDRFNKTTVGEFRIGNALPAVAKPSNITPGGLNYSYYEGWWSALPDFRKMKPVRSGIASKEFNVNNMPRSSDFATLLEGYIEIQKDGQYIFVLDSDDGSRLFLGDHLLIDYDGTHGGGKPKTYLVPLAKGFYPVRLEYFQQGGGAHLSLHYVLPGEEQPQPIPLELQYSKH